MNVTMKTSELNDHVLNWAVAKCEGVESIGILYTAFGEAKLQIKTGMAPCEYEERVFNYAYDWAQGGPIIAREGISLDYCGEDGWFSIFDAAHKAQGETPLIAAMRCYVASKLGDEIEVPEVLLIT